MNSIDEPYYVAFCCDDNYTQYVRVTILSILENNPNKYINIYVLTDYLSKRNIKNLQALSSLNPQLNLFIIKVDDTALKNLPTTKNWTLHTWYRLLIPQYIDKSISKILYLDADTLVGGSLKDLFNINLDNKSIAATPEANFFNSEFYQRLGYDKHKGYICAGVMLMNLDYWRDHNLAEKAIKWAKINKNQLKLLDQDAINYICQDSKIILPLKYGVVQWYYVIEEFYKDSFHDQLIESVNSPLIIHYAFTPPWYKDCQKHIFHDLWISYNNKLKKPARVKYRSKGFLKLKLMVWNFIHPENKPCISKDSILDKLKLSY
ncbi:MAG: glycosyltransferase family 8 protein [Erysipelotrichales bacterium]|nr:glycosyltransferase family 8 protein [Erysipelotrichales bacterium]